MQIPNEAKLALSELLPLALDAQIVGITTDGMVDSLRLVCDAQLAKAAHIIEALARKEERKRVMKLVLTAWKRNHPELYSAELDNLWDVVQMETLKEGK